MIDILNFSKYFASFFFFVLVVLGSFEARNSPVGILLLGVLLSLIGLPLVIYVYKTIKKYSNVFDYERTLYWNKDRNGKEVREILVSLNTIGLGCFLSGLVLISVVIFKIQIIPIVIPF